MVESETDDETLSHDDVATKLRNIADEFESDERPEIDLGKENETVTPQEQVNYQVTVDKNTSRLVQDAEAVSIELSWPLEE